MRSAQSCWPCDPLLAFVFSPESLAQTRISSLVQNRGLLLTMPRFARSQQRLAGGFSRLQDFAPLPPGSRSPVHGERRPLGVGAWSLACCLWHFHRFGCCLFVVCCLPRGSFKRQEHTLLRRFARFSRGKLRPCFLVSRAEIMDLDPFAASRGPSVIGFASSG